MNVAKYPWVVLVQNKADLDEKEQKVKKSEGEAKVENSLSIDLCHERSRRHRSFQASISRKFRKNSDRAKFVEKTDSRRRPDRRKEEEKIILSKMPDFQLK